MNRPCLRRNRWQVAGTRRNGCPARRGERGDAVRPGDRPLAARWAPRLTAPRCDTSFGDVHYFYGPETQSPRHHRFDKGSYVYLFENANDGRARVEIANHPGTDDQDAFDGCKSRRRGPRGGSAP